MQTKRLSTAERPIVPNAPSPVKRLIAAVVAIFFAFTGVITTATVASADTEPVTISEGLTFAITGTPPSFNGKPVLEEGQSFGFKINYGAIGQ